MNVFQILVVIWVALVVEIQAWQYRPVGVFVVPPVGLCIIGMWFIADRKCSLRKAFGTMLLGFGTFCVGAVFHFFQYEWDAGIRGNFFFSWYALAVGVFALIILAVSV